MNSANAKAPIGEWSKNYKLEIIGFNIESCKIAQNAGADRIELCDNPGDGGTTPSYGFIKVARAALQIELYSIIRPRGGDFLYSEDEFKIMQSDIQLCKKLGCDGIVTGMLNADGTVDKERCAVLVELAYPLGVTFHRAFDRTIDPFNAMEDIIEIGFERILTSGQKQQASDGAGLIAKLIEQAGERIIIMPGSAVRSDNIISIAASTNAVEFHSSARMNVNSKMNFNREDMNDQLKTILVDEIEIKKLKKILGDLQKQKEII
jgi:copper homeostasis protein